MTTDSANTTRRSALAGGAGLAVAAFMDRAMAQPAKAEEIVDIHAHIRSEDRTKYPPLPTVTSRGGQTVEQLIAEMDSAGIAKACCVQLSTFYGPDDSYMADSLPKAPKRLTGVCSINVLAPNATTVLEGWLKRGCTGIRIFTGGSGPSTSETLDDPRSFPVWEYCQDHKVPVCVQTAAEGLPKAKFLAQRYSKTTIILDHGSHPDLTDGPPYRAAQSLFDMAAFSNVNVKISPPLFALTREGKSTPDAFFQALVKAFGANRIAFGSNLPQTAGPMTKIVADARACLASLSAADRAMIMAGTAKRLYPALA
jgi:predicted TIM-barrel fold metal-dependent hydrolase